MAHHHLTVDVEEYFHPTALASSYPMGRWDGLERRAPRVVDRILELFGEHGARGTFFVVGWLAEREPGMVRGISEAGHEIASHGQEHRLVGDLGPEGLRASVSRSKKTLEDITGLAVAGYRAPSFSIVPGLEWAFDVLLEAGYRYDASLFPVSQHPTYGYPDAHPDPFVVTREAGALEEFPATTLRVLGTRIPAAGGAYFRLLPYALTRAGLRQAERRGAPGMFYTHPWELDDWEPRVAAPRLQRLRTFAGRARAWRNLKRLVTEFRFDRIDRTLDAVGASAT